MPQTAIMLIDGSSETISLPELSKEEIKNLGEKLDLVRGACIMSQRSRLGDHYYLVKNNHLGTGSFLNSYVCAMMSGTDNRKKIIELEDEVFRRFIQLLADMAQDDHRILKMHSKILKDFGLI